MMGEALPVVFPPVMQLLKAEETVQISKGSNLPTRSERVRPKGPDLS